MSEIGRFGINVQMLVLFLMLYSQVFDEAMPPGAQAAILATFLLGSVCQQLGYRMGE